MIVRDLRVLLQKLNKPCTKAIESTVGQCVGRGHYELTWEHLFYELLDETNNELARILDHFKVDKARLRKELTRELEQFPSGNGGKPSFSPGLITLMEGGWNLASLYYGRDSISSGVLFVAAFEQARRSTASYATLLRHIDPEKLKAELPEIVKGASEEEFVSSSGAAGSSGPDGAGVEVLEQFCTNFTRDASEGKIDPVSGRDDEIRQVLDILSRRRKNNPILVGEAGVGKTAVVEGLALRIVAGDVPQSLKGVELWGLDLGLLQAGASVKGEFEKRLKNVIDAVKNSAGKIVLFIDEAHTLIGAGGAAGQGDAANLLKPALARGELRTLAATTWSEYRKYFEKDPALARRFQLVKVEEPDEEKAFTMLRGIGRSYEKHHGVHITDTGIKAAVSMSHRYISGRQLPDKAVDVLDTACTRVKMSQTTTPASIDRATRLLSDTKRALAALHKDQQAGISVAEDEMESLEQTIEDASADIEALNKKWEEEKKRVADILEMQKALGKEDISDKEKQTILELVEQKTKSLEDFQGESPMVFPNVSSGVCAQVIADWTGIPVGSMMRDEAQTLLEVEDRLATRVIGQDWALSELANTIRSSKTGMGNPDAPLGVFLFTGPSGVGKTETALALADILFGGEKFLTTINMSEYQEKHTVSQLKGSPPGYVGYGEGGILTEAVRQKPYSIVLLDEVEKAHLEVMNLFYQVFDKGFMRDGEGREINFRNTLIIMTSNLASDQIIDMCANVEEIPSGDTMVNAIRPTLCAHFQPALLGRVKIVPFYPLGTEQMKAIVALKLDKIAQRIMAHHGMQFGCSEEFIERIAQSCTAVEAGARNADTMIDQMLLPQISRQLLAQLGEDAQPFDRIMVGIDDEDDFALSFERSGAQDLQSEMPNEQENESDCVADADESDDTESEIEEDEESVSK
ncbi:MAG: type VI secretion system ATPase TssH [Chitinivibrionales bacterium]